MRNSLNLCGVASGLLIALLCTFNDVYALQSEADSPDWSPRLEALSPDNPMAYFELAEEVADSARTTSETDLARHLFGLAGTLDPARLGRSACLALADLAENPQRKRRLLALASLLDDRGWRPAGEQRTNEIDPAAALALGEAFSYYRSGEGSQALSALRDSGADQLLEEYDEALFIDLPRFETNAEVYRNGREPTIRSDDLIEMLQLEAALLGGENRSFSSDLLLSRGNTLIEVDPARLDEVLGADRSRPYFRDGRRVSEP